MVHKKKKKNFKIIKRAIRNRKFPSRPTELTNKMNNINSNNHNNESNGWINNNNDRAEYLGTMMREHLEAYVTLYEEEKRVHWLRLQKMNNYLIPTMIEYSHEILGPKATTETYKQQLKNMVQKLMKGRDLPATAKTLVRRLEVQDPWMNGGGPPSPLAGDVGEKLSTYDLLGLFGLTMADLQYSH